MEREASMVPVDCAVNDDHGIVSERITAIHFPGLELDAIDMTGPRFRELRRGGEFRIKISRREWAARHLRSCVGNIYWERYGLESWTAAALLHWLRESKTFTLDGGWGELCDWWETQIVDHAHVRHLLIAAAKEDRL
jgi:hypothetical protein